MTADISGDRPEIIGCGLAAFSGRAYVKKPAATDEVTAGSDALR